MSQLVEPLHLRAGEWVQIRSITEILATLDSRGRMDGLPFMPEMLSSCGKQFRVFKRAHKTCDTVNKTGGRRMHAAVHLEGVRCDGMAHGGCGADCLMFWKEAWLKRVNAPKETPHSGSPETSEAVEYADKRIWSATTTDSIDSSDDTVYSCQITELPRATKLLSHWDIRQYWEDWRSGNEKPWMMVGPFVFRAFFRLSQAGIGIGRPLRWLYERFQQLRGGPPFPFRNGTVPSGTRTPSAKLNLQPGEVVRVKDFKAILDTLDGAHKNRGMWFDAEQVSYCGGTYRVRSRVKRIIDEKTGRMMEFKKESVILDGVVCNARCSDRRLFCPRAIPPYWRDIWLERVLDEPPQSPSA